MTELRARPDVDVTSRPLDWNPRRRAISAVPYLPGLDGLRALAVVAVIIYHTNRGWLHGGFIGVEVFFVISGYLITLLIIAEHERTGRLDLKQFWLRRARRLLPALFFMIALLVIYVALFNRRELGKLRGDAFAGLGYISNWYQIWVGQGYTAVNDFAALRHLWSLAVEEQYYLLWPLAMLGLMRLGRRRLPEISLWLIGVALALAAVTAVLFYSGPVDPVAASSPGAYWEIGGRAISKNDTLYLSTITRATGLLLGAAFAMLWRPVAMMRGPMRHKARQLDAVAIGGIVLLGVLAYHLFVSNESGRFDGRLFRGGFLLVGLATIMIIPAVTHRQSLVARGLSNPVFVWIGTRSYGLYLFHWPIYQILRERAGEPLTDGDFAIAMVATLALTEFSYRFVETPIRKRRVRKVWEQLADNGDPKPRHLVVLGGVAVAGLLAFSSVSMVTAELRQNELAETLIDNEESVTDLGELIDGTQPAQPAEPTATAVPATQPVGAAETTPPTEVPTTTENPLANLPKPIPQLAIGDSVMKGTASQLEGKGFLVDATESRQFSAGLALVRQLSEAGYLDGTQQVVIHLGTNGTIETDDLNEMLQLLSGVPKVIVLTVAGNQSWIAGNNTKIEATVQQYPNAIVGYFAQLAEQCGADCYADSNLHMNAKGAAYYADAIVYWFDTSF